MPPRCPTPPIRGRDRTARNTAAWLQTRSARRATMARGQRPQAERTPAASCDQPGVPPRHHREDGPFENPGPRLPVIARIHLPPPKPGVFPEIQREPPAAEGEEKRNPGVRRQVRDDVGRDARERQPAKPGPEYDDR